MKRKLYAGSIKDSNILIVEDTEFNVALISTALKDDGYGNIYVAKTGAHALEILASEEIDLILLDLVLPDISGLQICKMVRQDPRTKLIPIIVQTASDKVSEKQKAFALGASDFVTKPIEEIELIARVTNQLKQRQLFQSLESAYMKMELELEDAQKAMQSMLPKPDAIKSLSDKYNLSIDAIFRPSSKLGGDFYDIIEFDDRKIGFYLWDFSGHGMAAAINTFRLYSIISNPQQCMVRKAGSFLSSINEILFNMLERQYFATMFYGVLDPQERTLEFSCASCPPPLLLSFERKKFVLLDSKEFPLGIIDNHEYKARTIDLHNWDAVLLYSDALIETSNENNQFLDIEELATYLSENMSRDTPAEVIKQEVMNKFGKTRIDNLKDDLTFNVLTFNEPKIA